MDTHKWKTLELCQNLGTPLESLDKEALHQKLIKPKRDRVLESEQSLQIWDIRASSHAVSFFMEAFLSLFPPWQHLAILKDHLRDFPVVQWLTLDTVNTGGPGSIPGQGTKPHMPQLRLGAAR